MRTLVRRLRKWAEDIERDEPDNAARLREASAALDRHAWMPIETAPTDGTVVILANFEAMCLLTRAPHVWTARWEPEVGEGGQWCECSYAAINENGVPTHWTTLPHSPAEEMERLANRLKATGVGGALLRH
jgi:hypothetical protein